MKPRNAAEVHALLAKRADTRPRNAAPTVTVEARTATVRLFEPINSRGEWWGMSAIDLATTLDGLPTDIDTIRLLINSPGGNVFEGIAMTNTLRSHRARVIAVVQGIAASAASFIAVSADETVMAPNSEMMIHNAWGTCVGDYDDMREMANNLDRLSDNIATMYATKAGGTTAYWRERMGAETWYTANGAINAGLADRLDDAIPAANQATHNASDNDGFDPELTLRLLNI